MEFGICHLNCIALRKDPSDQSEMLSQILFGETFKVLVSEGEWIKIHLDYDFYEGWVHRKQIEELNNEVYHKISQNKPCFSNELVTFITDKNDQLQVLTLGAVLPRYKEGVFSFNDFNYDFDGEVINSKLPKSNLVRTAYKFLNAPFLWGGRPMKIEVPEQLQATKDLLIHSLPAHSQEQAPPVPEALMQDFAERFAPQQAAPAPKVVEGQFIDKVQQWKDEYEATITNLADAAWRLKDEYGLPGGWELVVYEWLSEHDCAAIEDRDDRGAYPTEHQLRAAFDDLGFDRTALPV